MDLTNWQQQPVLIAESFRRTVASLLFSSSARLRPKVIVVTSPAQGDGKSTVSSNICIALAEIRLRVLLIDCDLRHPRLHKVFDIANTWGVSDILAETSSIATLPREAFCRDTKIPNLQLLTSGPPPGSVSELLFSERLEQLIARCRNEFDVIVIDTPPILPVSDARAVCRHSDGVVLVLRAGCSKIKAAVASTELLRRDGAPILGTVLNDWDPRMSGGANLYDLYYTSQFRRVG
jgi:capsular exopolysaccharide synthesis family protein